MSEPTYKTMHRSSDVIRPKSKVEILLRREDGTTLQGHVYVGGQERILDLVNDRKPFLPFETRDGKMLLINKRSIAVIEPFDQERMQQSHRAAPTMQPSAAAKQS